MTQDLEIGSMVRIVKGKKCRNAIGTIIDFWSFKKTNYAIVEIISNDGQKSIWRIPLSYLHLTKKIGA